ncbi:MAG: hypothetical protein AMJ46_02830 [Latescibacteria bacterium DG_63]|nr:MAG: hypothetical protein AMJ46_02830 [Latescibacteria bacterium DG_63]
MATTRPASDWTPVATFSIVAFDPETGDLGAAVQSKFFAVGTVVPWAKAGIGAIATQAFANTTYGPGGLKLLAEGRSPQEVIDALTSSDEERERRQVGVVDAKGNAATFTGKECFAWAGGRTGENYAVQGNILTGEEVATAMCEGFEKAQGELADKLLAALEAGQAAGGDSRGKQSAALVVAREAGGYGSFNDRYIDIRVDDHKQPIKELGRLLQMQHSISWTREAFSLYEEGKYKKAVEALEKALKYNPDSSDNHYNLACLYSLAGEKEKSLESLRTALKLNPQFRSLAEEDSDFDNVRSDPRFKELLSQEPVSTKE